MKLAGLALLGVMVGFGVSAAEAKEEDCKAHNLTASICATKDVFNSYNNSPLGKYDPTNPSYFSNKAFRDAIDEYKKKGGYDNQSNCSDTLKTLYCQNIKKEKTISGK